MAKTQQIKNRIGSVKSTKQITRAMEMVAASKLRKAQQASARSRAMRNSAREILARLSQLTNAAQFELYDQRIVTHSKLYVVFTSDRGLAGAYNSNILRLLLKEVKQNHADATTTKVIAIGKKGAQAIAKYEGVELSAVYEDWPIEPSATQISPLFRELTRMFVEAEADQVQLIYTDFKSALVQEAKLQQLLPSSLDNAIENVEVGRNINNATFEPNADAVVAKIVPWLVEIQLLQAALEASASEQSMRRLAMKAATDNATDLIDDLTLEFNSARQAAITQELAEISGGVAAMS